MAVTGCASTSSYTREPAVGTGLGYKLLRNGLDALASFRAVRAAHLPPPAASRLMSLLCLTLQWTNYYPQKYDCNMET